MTHSLSGLRTIFERACDLTPGERSGYLDQACADDDRLRKKIERLLAADASEDARLTTGVPELLDAAARLNPESLVGRKIGGFVVEEPLDRGGSGTVLVATQDRPRRKVALKVARTDVLSPAARARFLLEAEILGLLTHPNVARVYAAGIEDVDGTPLAYLAVELVEGARDLVAFAQAGGLARRARLELFCSLCDAVQHGHQKGVVHRDLKPENVLVDGAGHLRVIDFGIAHVLPPDAAASTGTAGLVAGTPPYMSPEQKRTDGEVDTRTDVFALGVILHQLLTDRLPDEDEAFDGTATDLRLIVRRAMAEQRDERYPTAAALGQDVAAFLQGEPVSAHPPGVAYTARRFVGRHRLTTALAAALAVLVIVFAVFAWREAGKLRTERDRVLAEAHKFERSTEFFASILGTANPKLGDLDRTVIEALDATIPRIPELLGDEPEVEAHVRNLVADKLLELGRYEEYERERRRVIAILDALADPDVSDRVEARLTLAAMMVEWVRTQEALVLVRESQELLRGSRQPLPELEGEAARLAGGAKVLAGEPALGRALVEGALQTFEECDEESGVIRCLEELAYLEHDHGELSLAIDFARACYERAQAFYPPGDGTRVFRGMLLPVYLGERGAPEDLEEARALLAEMIAELREIFGPGSFYEAVWRRNLGKILFAQGLTEASLAEERLALDIVLALYPKTHSEVGRTRSVYAEVLVEAGRFDEARLQLSQALEVFRAAYDYQEDHYEIRGIQKRLAALDADQ